MNKISVIFLLFGWMNKDQLKRKGIFYLIDAISELNQKNSIPRNFKLTIAGKKGNYTEQLKKTIFKKNFLR